MIVRIKLHMNREEYEKSGIISATIVKTNRKGTIERRFLTKKKIKELKIFGYANILQSEFRVI